MKIALLGYGKMGKAIEEIALGRGHEIVCRIGIENLEDRTAENLQQADVVIEFTGPESAADNIRLCIGSGVPVVSGSTGWLNSFDEIKSYCRDHKGGFLYASNFSVGVNLFFALNKKLAGLMAAQPDYEVSMTEIHHTQKLDAPSGTAITLAEQILERHPVKKQWVNQPTGRPEDLVIISERTDPAPGTHLVEYHSDIDDITIIHKAHNRKGFATGAVLAAEFLAGHPEGIYSMQDVINL